MQADDRLAFVRGVPLFAEARLDDAALAQLAAALQPRQVPAGAAIFAEGDNPDGMYLVAAGRVRIVKTVGATRVPLAELGSGEQFGELALLDSGPRSAGAEAGEGGATLLFLPARGFEALLDRAPRLGLAFFRLVSARLRAREKSLGEPRPGDSEADPVELGYPFPIASIYRSWRVLTEPRARLDRLLDLLEATVRYLASVAIANYLASGPGGSSGAADFLDATLVRGLDRATLGTLLLVVQRSGEPFDAAPERLWMPELLRFTHERRGRVSASLQALEKLVTFRNHVRHGGGGMSGRELEQELVAQEARFRDVLSALAFLAAYPPVWIAGMEFKGGKFLYQVDVAVGSHSEFRRQAIALREPREGGQLLLWKASDGSAVTLHPLVLLDTCEACGNREAFFFVGVEGGSARYVEVRRGHRHAAAEPVEAIGRLQREAQERLRLAESAEAV